VRTLLTAFDKRYLILVSKNFLRFSKGRGFKEISLAGSMPGIEDTYSEVFLSIVRKQLL
jgi:hypothetical protein